MLIQYTRVWKWKAFDAQVCNHVSGGRKAMEVRPSETERETEHYWKAGVWLTVWQYHTDSQEEVSTGSRGALEQYRVPYAAWIWTVFYKSTVGLDGWVYRLLLTQVMFNSWPHYKTEWHILCDIWKKKKSCLEQITSEAVRREGKSARPCIKIINTTLQSKQI